MNKLEQGTPKRVRYLGSRYTVNPAPDFGDQGSCLYLCFPGSWFKLCWLFLLHRVFRPYPKAMHAHFRLYRSTVSRF